MLIKFWINCFSFTSVSFNTFDTILLCYSLSLYTQNYIDTIAFLQKRSGVLNYLRETSFHLFFINYFTYHYGNNSWYYYQDIKEIWSTSFLQNAQQLFADDFSFRIWVNFTKMHIINGYFMLNIIKARNWTDKRPCLVIKWGEKARTKGFNAFENSCRA